MGRSVTHLQPLDQIRPGKPQMDPHSGMASVATKAGIRLGKYPGLGIPVVLSIDFIVTVPSTVGAARLVGFSCKPMDVIMKAESNDRLRERLELDRSYCVAAKIPHHIVHPEQISQTLMVQLHWLAPIEPWEQLKSFISSERYLTYLEHLRKTAYEVPVCNASRKAGTKAGWFDGEDQRALRIAIWYQHLDVDLAQPLHTTRPVKPGGISQRALLQRLWLGRRS